MKAKEKIVQAAIELFNTHCSTTITTNHIAAKAEVSPGSLYYHFRNKEEIIRYIHSELIQPILPEPMELPPEQLDQAIIFLDERINCLFQSIWKYRFFPRERSILMNNDPVLKKEEQKFHERQITHLSEKITHFMTIGVFKEMSESTLRFFTCSYLILGQNWQVFLELEQNEMTEQIWEEGLQLIRFNLKPYLTPIASQYFQEKYAI
ncbi:MAG: AcrR family transcriptional regulator [bacterium]|jgi:AcrR family transcriptional regulator